MKKTKSTTLVIIMSGLLTTTTLLAQTSDLFSKVTGGDIQAVKELIASGADINQLSENGNTPLIVACLYKQTEIAKYLINSGADVNVIAKDGNTALLISASYSKELIELLLSKNADITVRTEDAGVFTNCITGILAGRIPVGMAEMLLCEGADIDEECFADYAYGYTPLMMAANWDNEELIRFLIRNGANVNVRARDGHTPLTRAEKNGNPDIIKILKDNGAEK